MATVKKGAVAAGAETPPQDQKDQLPAVPGNNGALALPEDLSWMTEYQDKFKAEERQLPWLRIIQTNTPQRMKQDPSYIQGAEEGMIFNTATRELHSGEEGITLVAVKFQRSITEWVPRDDGGGFVADHGSDTSVIDKTTKDEKGKLMLPSGHEIVDAPLYYVLQILGPNHFVPAALSMAGSGWRAARSWNTQMSMLRIAGPNGAPIPNPPTFMGVWRTGTAFAENERGKFFRWTQPAFLGAVFKREDQEYLLQQVREFRQQLDKGLAKANVADREGGGDEPKGDIPF